MPSYIGKGEGHPCGNDETRGSNPNTEVIRLQNTRDKPANKGSPLAIDPQGAGGQAYQDPRWRGASVDGKLIREYTYAYAHLKCICSL